MKYKDTTTHKFKIKVEGPLHEIIRSISVLAHVLKRDSVCGYNDGYIEIVQKVKENTNN